MKEPVWKTTLVRKTTLRRRRLIPGTLLLLVLSACAPSEEAPPAGGAPAPAPAAVLDLPEGADAAAAAITGDGLREVVRELSDDALEGRAPGTPGDQAARQSIAARLEALGLEPGGPDGSWQQPFEVVGIDAEVPETWTFHAGDTDFQLAWWDEFIAASGVQRERAQIDGAELVFVGYGIQAPEHDWDDFKGADLAGKVLVMLNNDPDWDPQLFEGERRLYYGRWTYKYESAAAHGATAAIIVHTTESAGYPWQVVQSSWSGEQFELPAGEEPRIEVAAWTTYDAAQTLFAAAGRDLAQLTEAARERDFAPVALGITTSLTLENRVSRGVETANVLGLLPGADPALADEVVIYTAHHDHLGRGNPNDAGDDIYNGARDNASGVAQVLAVAGAFKALPEPPRRSILFALVAAEEQGLLGSEHYALAPTFPPGKIAANVNLDAGNIWGSTRDVTFIGYGKSSLDAVVEAAAALQDRVVVGDQFPDRGFFYRSDQFNLAKIGVPALYVSSGTDFRGREPGWGEAQIEAWTGEHYHQPSDELDDTWSFDGLVEDARLSFYCGLALAQADAMPAWNRGDEFEAARLEALAATGE
jgi:Zn-dependent M28 family amino/carboxypeptidase